MASGKFSLQWVNNTDHTRPMGSARFNLRDSLASQGEGGLTCGRLHLDQVHIHFRPPGTATSPVIADDEFTRGDNRDLEWVNETLQLYVRITPGERYTLYTSPKETPAYQTSDTMPHPQRSLVYSAALSAGYATSGDGDDTFCKTYRPIRDLPVLYHASNLSEIQVDLLWPLLQGDPSAAWWGVPEYRILRVICEFSYTP